MIKKFISKIDEARLKALTYIREVLTKRGDNPYELIDPSMYEDEIHEDVCKLPKGMIIDGFDSYSSFSLVDVSINDNDELMFGGVSTIDIDYRNFIDDELDTEVICKIADIIFNLEK